MNWTVVARLGFGPEKGRAIAWVHKSGRWTIAMRQDGTAFEAWRRATDTERMRYLGRTSIFHNEVGREVSWREATALVHADALCLTNTQVAENAA